MGGRPAGARRGLRCAGSGLGGAVQDSEKPAVAVLPDLVEDELELEPDPVFGHLWVVVDGAVVVVVGLLAMAAGLLATAFELAVLAVAVVLAEWVTVCVARLGCALATAAPMPAVPPTKARPATTAPIACFRMVLSLSHQHNECR